MERTVALLSRLLSPVTGTVTNFMVPDFDMKSLCRLPVGLFYGQMARSNAASIPIKKVSMMV